MEQINEILVDAVGVGCVYHNGQTTVTALESASCQIKPRARIALMGPSGSGKSTLLQCIGGLEIPTSGLISWPAMGDRNALRPQHVGIIFQAQSLLAPLSVIENVELPLLLNHTGRTEARKRAEEALEQLDLQMLADKLPEECSGGQAQRAAVARVLACRPKLILADEPTGQLDHATAQSMLDVLLSALGQSECSLLVATHDLKVAERMDTVWTMRNGRLDVPTR
ncbi:ATP-binding cassette domain-containing protein [Paenibacillus sp. sptzw28]|uniref:ABC transporter ATP-binding protein n=1 Tax=Paenibacillus sp. sptzw28 TaxID=715179 RepID=UPI001C6EFE20|nr:ATP-binding cassette domain-containing protein [Paenibacillus sp. sptzw28]QYR19348.1 ATP-binding cassette domain-containing protein [Paenibacillus sp. sptzw28]